MLAFKRSASGTLISAMITPAHECEFAVGDNSEHGYESPWAHALVCIYALPMGRYYTVRRADFPDDHEEVLALMAAHVEEQGNDSDAQSLANELSHHTSSQKGEILIACHITTDGLDYHDIITTRAKSAHESLWHPNPVPKGESAIGIGDRWVRMKDIPKPLLQEVVVGLVCLHSTSGAHGKAGELRRVYVAPDHEDFGLEKALLDTMSSVAQQMGYERLSIED